MGSSSSNCSSNNLSNSIDSDKYGNFKYENCCSHSPSEKKVFEMKEGSVLFTNFSPINKLGNSIGYKPCHSFVTLKYKCDNCKQAGNFTVDYVDSGIRERPGKYFKLTDHISRNKSLKSSDTNLVSISLLNQKLRKKYNKNNYNYKSNNCQNYSKEFYDQIK